VVHAEPKTETLTIIGTIQDVTEQREARRALDDVTRALERERELVQMFQKAVAAPAFTHGAHVHISYSYCPAESAMIGGDWYDVLPLSHGRVLLVIADVAGHGLAAASTMSEIRTALRVLSMRESRPSRLIEEIDRYVSTSRDAAFTTMLLVRFDEETGECTAASAGHVPAIEFGNGDAEIRWVATGPPLGSDAGTREDSTFTLESGRSLVMYSDGLIERRDASIDDGLSRLCACVGTVPADLTTLAETIVHDLCNGRELRDDVAVLTLHRRDRARTVTFSMPADPHEIRGLRSRVRRWLASFDGDDIAVEDIALAVSELAANACIHAYEVGTTGEYSVDGTVEGEDVRITVADRGTWKSTPQRDGGRGLALVEALARDVSIDRSDRGTTVEFRARFKAMNRDDALPAG
jgi:serine phosphatase RsbU (regulator of sigma subunit)/anti-sigma regulatory factor (Ser/Thr protein kinase)